MVHHYMIHHYIGVLVSIGWARSLRGDRAGARARAPGLLRLPARVHGGARGAAARRDLAHRVRPQDALGPSLCAADTWASSHRRNACSLLQYFPTGPFSSSP